MTALIPSTTAQEVPASLPRVLLVDDEVAILDGLRRQLRRTFDVTTAIGADMALEILREDEPFAVVLSDMRMPGMDGAAFLTVVRRLYPDSTRMILTGQADTESAIAAINDGQIHCFLTKPCLGDDLVSALSDGVALHRQVTAERDVLESTLRGAVQALLDALALASPKAFGRAVRIRDLVTDLAETLEVPLTWELEVAGMLAQLGAVTVPTPVLGKLDSGRLLTEEEAAMIAAVPQVTERLISGIPRLESLAAAIGQQRLRYDGHGRPAGAPVGDDLPLASRLLRLAVDIDTMRSQRLPAEVVLSHLRKDSGAYDPTLLERWEGRHHEDEAAEAPPLTVELEDLRPGMVLVEDVVNARGVVLLGRGSSVTETVLQRLRNHASHGGVSGPVTVRGPVRPPARSQS